MYLNVPQILQNPELPNGCEITSLCELLNFYGFPAEKCDLADHYLPRSQKWKGADPNLVYMGNPHLDDSSEECGYYCFAGPVIAAAKAYLKDQGAEEQYSVSDLTGADEKELVDELNNGNPFLFWASLDFTDIQHDDCWFPLTDGSIHHVFHHLHCMVCRGLEDGCFLIADPLNLNIKVPCEQFMKIYCQLGSRAVVIRKK